MCVLRVLFISFGIKFDCSFFWRLVWHRRSTVEVCFATSSLYLSICLLSYYISVQDNIVFLLGGLISIHATAEWICKLGNVAYISPEVRREWLEYHWLNYQFTLFGNLLLRVIPLHPTSAGPNPNSVLVRLLALHLHILNKSTNFNTIQDEKS